MQEENARGTRLHVTSVGGKRARGPKRITNPQNPRLALEAPLDPTRPYEGIGMHRRDHEN